MGQRSKVRPLGVGFRLPGVPSEERFRSPAELHLPPQDRPKPRISRIVMYVHIYIYIYMYTHTYMYMSVYGLQNLCNMKIHRCVDTHIHIYTHTYLCVYEESDGERERETRNYN